ncbi:hypothetical protein SAMN06265371_101413 [Lutibacter agarilyticus]|uniref:Uncharacterized protein n=1 Tax=Lutibacter agarilyticus TaxID=1109740 RepID=A0A238VHK9_9FLAO|nr:hypothetical protein SAMN06265371_101413 [Lutibacter agarilyticus]
MDIEVGTPIGFVHFFVTYPRAKYTDFFTPSSVGKENLFLVYFPIFSIKVFNKVYSINNVSYFHREIQ